jgi:hypothetical protein
MALTQWQLKPVATDTIASGDFIAFTDENETGDPINKLTIDNLMETGIPLVTEDAIADGDYLLFLDGGASGNTNKEAVHDLATLFAGAGMTATSSVLNVIGGDGITANANDVAITAAQTTVTSVYNASLKMGRDSQNLIDFATTDDKIILRVANVDEVELVANVLQPTTSDGVALGTGSLMWSDLFLASGSVINFNNGDITATHSANTLTFAGGTVATAALTGTTIDASTDFTIGDTVITDGVITDTSGLSIAANVSLADDKVINLGEAGKVDFGDEAPDDNEATGIVFSFLAGATLAIGDVVYIHTDGEVAKADADAVTSMPAVGICVGAGTDGNAVDVLVQGIMHDTSAFPTFTVGADVFVDTTAGAVTATAPSGSGDTVQKIGVATHADMIYFNFNTTEVLLA